ncbi:uncharacterized protein LOC115684039 isoform X2 [Syzygium oleosum]|uniref:uncharacterized protein LOC115684039 isoform X2 n=1 Tax=Syzygium oleosum TaxID=219896 RepID=UPI0011D18079|nr:uncharacterized protein LOC115684039 isoform X2 [Syzygium oleosum]
MLPPGGEAEEDRADGVLRGGDGGVAAGVVAAGAGGGRGRARALGVDLELHLRVYAICDGPALSHGPYLGTVTLSSVISILILSVKACVFSINSQIVAEVPSSLARKKLHLKKSWGMPVLFLSSVVFALGHTVVAYRTSCRARRKLLFHRVDPEAVLSCKTIFSVYQKVPRSPTPTAGKTTKSDSETRQKPMGSAHGEGDIPIRFLTDVDSLFMTCQGLTIHYKLCSPSSPSHVLSSAAFSEPNVNCTSPQTVMARLNIDRQAFSALPKSQYLQRSYSSQFNTSSLYAPLLDSSVPYPMLAEEIPALNLDDADVEDQAKNLNSTFGQDSNSGQFGIVLIHGFGGGVFSWRHVMGVLSRQVGCAVVAFDRPGWGLTSRPRRKSWEQEEMPNPYKLDTQVDLLLSFCAEMGFTSVVLVGHDDGGQLALRAAQKVQTSSNSFNIVIEGIVLVSVGLSREVVPGFARILLHTSLGKKHLVRPLLRAEITQVVSRRAWYDARKIAPEFFSLYKAPLFVEGWDEALHEIGKLSYEFVLSPQYAAGLLKAVEDTPVLVIAGAEDALISLKSTQSMASKLVNSRLVAISGCGHLPHEECPKALVAAISPFITKLLSTLESVNQ